MLQSFSAMIVLFCCFVLMTHAQNSDVEIHGSNSHTRLHLFPETPGSADSTSIFLSEDNNGTFGMSILYDGVFNQMQIFGKSIGTEYGPHLVIDRGSPSGPSVGIGSSLFGYAFNVEGNARVSDYSQLGSDAPKIKMKKYTGTMPSAQGNCANIPYSESLDKILAINVTVHNTVAPRIVGPNRSGTFYHFRWVADWDGNFKVCAVDGESSGVLNMPITILVTYEE